MGIQPATDTEKKRFDSLSSKGAARGWPGLMPAMAASVARTVMIAKSATKTRVMFSSTL